VLGVSTVMVGATRAAAAACGALGHVAGHHLASLPLVIDLTWLCWKRCR